MVMTGGETREQQAPGAQETRWMRRLGEGAGSGNAIILLQTRLVLGRLLESHASFCGVRTRGLSPRAHSSWLTYSSPRCCNFGGGVSVRSAVPPPGSCVTKNNNVHAGLKSTNALWRRFGIEAEDLVVVSCQLWFRLPSSPMISKIEDHHQ